MGIHTATTKSDSHDQQLDTGLFQRKQQDRQQIALRLAVATVNFASAGQTGSLAANKTVWSEQCLSSSATHEAPCPVQCRHQQF